MPTIPESLNEAIRVFILNVAIRKLRGQENKHNSMLVHATRFTAMHQKLSINIEEYKDAIKRDIEVYGALPNAHSHSELIKDINKNFIKTYFTNCVKEKLEFEWDEVLASLWTITVVYYSIVLTNAILYVIVKIKTPSNL